jgi:hypothetical protein
LWKGGGWKGTLWGKEKGGKEPCGGRRRVERNLVGEGGGWKGTLWVKDRVERSLVRKGGGWKGTLWGKQEGRARQPRREVFSMGGFVRRIGESPPRILFPENLPSKKD